MKSSIGRNWAEALRAATMSSVLFSLLLRPADWPIGPTDAVPGDIRELGNRVLFFLLTWLLGGTLSWATLRTFRRRLETSTAGVPPARRRVWPISALTAAGLCLAVDLAAPDRLLHADKVGIIPLEIRFCLVVVALAVLSPVLHRLWDGLSGTLRARAVLTPPQSSS